MGAFGNHHRSLRLPVSDSGLKLDYAGDHIKDLTISCNVNLICTHGAHQFHLQVLAIKSGPHMNAFGCFTTSSACS